MDGQSKIKRSLRFRLSIWIALWIVIISIFAGAVSFYLAYLDAYELQDEQLQQVSYLLGKQNNAVAMASSNITDDSDAQILVQNISLENTPLNQNDTWQLPSDLPNGLSSVSVGKTQWRVFVNTTADNQRIAVAQRTDIRDEAAFNSGMQTLLPLLALIPVLISVVIMVIHRAFVPVARLGEELAEKSENNLNPLSAELIPTEVLPFVLSINQLFARLHAAIAQQNRFIADAAHELRTPITALSLQAENLTKMTLPDTANERLSQLQSGLRRTQRLLEQLLGLARYQARSNPIEKVYLPNMIREVVSDLYPLAEEKNIDIGITREEPVYIDVNAADIRTLIQNAISNAIRYTPINGIVDIRTFVKNQQAYFEVQDNGIGISDADKHQVFEPFYRVVGTHEVGSGLGLAIVKKIAEHSGGSVTLHSVEPHGTLFQYVQALSQ